MTTRLTALLVLAAWPAVAAEGDVAIRGARIVTVSGPVIEQGNVVVSGGRIAAVGPTAAIPAGAMVIDGAGKTVYPGLIDAHTVLGLTEIGSVSGSVDTAEAGDVNPHARAWIALHPHSDLIPVARANGVTAAIAAPSGGLVSGQSALIRLAGSTPDDLTIKQPAAMHMNYPTGRPAFDISRAFDEPELATFEDRQRERKRNQQRELKRLAGLLAEAKAYGAALVQAKNGKAAAPAPDLPLEALGPVARGEVPVVMSADAEDDIRGAVKFAEENGLKLILSGGLEAWRCADLLREKNVAALIKTNRLPRRESDAYDAAFTNAAALHKAGVRFAIVTSDGSQARNLPYEAAMARAFGLPADAALRAITLSPAEIFGVEARLGSIEPGKDANLVVATGDILDVRTQVTHVFVGGVPQSLETRHTKLYQQFKDRP